MQIDEIRALFDQEQRVEVKYPDSRREVTPQVMRHVDLFDDGQGFILYTRLDETNAGQVIEEQIEYFTRIGQDFEWKVYDYDTPPDLKERLAARGFVVGEPEAVMVLDIQEAPEVLRAPVGSHIRKVSTAERMQDVLAILESVWQGDFTGLVRDLSRYITERPEILSVYVAYLDEKPVSCAWIFFHEHSQFASLWGGSTLPEYRQLGLYTGLLAARLQEAGHRQVRFLTVDAGPMSRPILEKYAFKMIATSYACKWPTRQKAE